MWVCSKSKDFYVNLRKTAQHEITAIHVSEELWKQVLYQVLLLNLKGPWYFRGCSTLFSCLFTSPTHHTSYQVTPDSPGFPKIALSESYSSNLGQYCSLVSGHSSPCCQHFWPASSPTPRTCFCRQSSANEQPVWPTALRWFLSALLV